MVGQASRSETETRNVLDPDAVATAMDEPPMPGSRVRATTKHGGLTVDEIAAMQPGMARLMDELSRRYWTLFYAAKARNWELASYMAKEAQKVLKTASVARPKYAEDIATFVRDTFGSITAAIESKNWPAFEKAYRNGISESDRLHDKYNKSFLRFRLPDHPPEWFDLAPR